MSREAEGKCRLVFIFHCCRKNGHTPSCFQSRTVMSYCSVDGSEAWVLLNYRDLTKLYSFWREESVVAFDSSSSCSVLPFMTHSPPQEASLSPAIRSFTVKVVSHYIALCSIPQDNLLISKTLIKQGKLLSTCKVTFTQPQRLGLQHSTRATVLLMI